MKFNFAICDLKQQKRKIQIKYFQKLKKVISFFQKSLFTVRWIFLRKKYNMNNLKKKNTMSVEVLREGWENQNSDHLNAVKIEWTVVSGWVGEIKVQNWE